MLIGASGADTHAGPHTAGPQVLFLDGLRGTVSDDFFVKFSVSK
ncbi:MULTISPECIES: hypothetical protein [Streptomyces]|uniref:Uncharacterized protein n=1 Tax=Streptomyces fimbriatus TaxID=68197 RepID=A0ABW0DK63_STRFI